MIIKGTWGEFEAPYLIALFICDEQSIKKPIEFLIDTGASKTTILDNDAIRLNIDYSKLKRLEEGTTGIGGTVDAYIIPNVRLMFRIREGVHKEKFEQIFVIKHIIKDKEMEERIRKIPSLLGRDFLNKYTLALNRKKKSVVITDEKVEI